MTETKLYFPFLDFEINGDKDNAHLRILEGMLGNGPAYELIVHDSEGWKKIEEEDLLGGMITIIDKKFEERIKSEVEEFFAPSIKSLKPYKDGNGQIVNPFNFTRNMRRALSYITIASKYNAWIYGNEILNDCLQEISRYLDAEEDLRKVCGDEGVDRVNKFKNLLDAYNTIKQGYLSSNSNSKLYYDFKCIYDEEIIKSLSKMNHNFGKYEYKFEQINLKSRELIQEASNFANSSNIKYIGLGAGIVSHCMGYNELGLAVEAVGIIGHFLKDFDFKKYAPPMVREQLFLDVYGANSFSLAPFNNEFQFSLENK